MKEHALGNLIEIIPDRLFWLAVDVIPKDEPGKHYFSIDDDLLYEPFNKDWGPFNLSYIYIYCKMLEAKLSSAKLADTRIVHCCSRDPHKSANAACLICAYQVIVQHLTAAAAYEPFCDMYPSFVPFRDAISGPCSYSMTISDCMDGLEKAMDLGWFDYRTFDLDAYDLLSRVDEIDANWIIPGKFLAFAQPWRTPRSSDGFPTHTPEKCVAIFKDLGIGLVVRLNQQYYDRHRFTDLGIKHADLYFADGTCPPKEIIDQFLHITENEPGPVAVHCKAGLGRTCTLMGLYAMKHYHFPARAFIGWARICRPGSVLGPQQQFLVNMECVMFSAISRCSSPHSQVGSPHSQVGESHTLSLSAAEVCEDVGQGDRLCNAKRVNQLTSPKKALPPIDMGPRLRSKSVSDLSRRNSVGGCAKVPGRLSPKSGVFHGRNLLSNGVELELPTPTQGVDMIGEQVLIAGLVRCPQWNGKIGKVKSYDPEMQRYIVRVMPDVPSDKVLLAKLKRDNLSVQPSWLSGADNYGASAALGDVGSTVTCRKTGVNPLLCRASPDLPSVGSDELQKFPQRRIIRG